MDTTSSRTRTLIGFLTSLKNTFRVCTIVAGCIFPTSAFPAESFIGPISPGFSLAWSYGDAEIEDNSDRDFNRVSGIGLAVSGYLEKPLSDIFRLSAELHFSYLTEFFDEASAIGTMVSLGGAIGRLNKPKSPYVAASLGYSYVDIADTGDQNIDNSCFIFCFNEQFREGGHAKGLGYRIAVGFTLNEKIRLELSQMNLGGDAGGLPDGSTLSMDTISFGIHGQFK